MVFKSPSEVCFYITENFPVYWYGIIVATACFTGVLVSYLIYKKFNPDKDYDKIWDISVWFLLAGIIGARLYYCLLNPVYYFHYPLEIFNIRGGGLSIHGGLITGITVLICYAYKTKLGILKLLDSFACGTAFAQSIGRWGNFFNSEAFGYPTDLPWKLYIPENHRPDIYANNEYFHPTFLYESILDFCLFIILYYVLKRFNQKYSGITFFAYLIFYAIIRIFVESFRIDSALNVAGVPIAKIISVIMLIAGITGTTYILKYKSKTTA